MTPRDQFIQSEMSKVLQPGEQIMHTAFMVKAPGLLLQMLLAGGLLQFLLTKAYYVAVTNQRLVMIRTSLGLFSPGMKNHGVESIPLHEIKDVKTGGLLNNRSMTFARDAGKLTLRIAPWSKLVTGQKEFLEQVPAMINTRQLPASA